MFVKNNYINTIESLYYKNKHLSLNLDVPS